MANRVLIDMMDQNNFNAGTKARNDVTQILNDCGFETIVMFERTHNNIFRLLEVLNATRVIGKNIKKNDIILLQYPYQIKLMKLMIRRINPIKRKIGCRFILLIHDVIYLRNESYISDNIEKIKQAEIDIFNSVDGIIVHNPIMDNELKRAGVRCNTYNLGLFDYLYTGQPANIVTSNVPIIVFAGNLSPEKSGFIYNYQDRNTVQFNLYGTMPSDLRTFYNYKGSFPPNELISSLEGNYGLVWDGPSADTCKGNYGNYLRYNDPHKFSLYIAAGLPVIVWEYSALAEFVKSNGIGIAISSLYELDKLPSARSEQYRSFLLNVSKLKTEVCSGNMLRKVINIILAEC